MAGERSFLNFAAEVADLESAAVERLTDAERLLEAGRYASSIAMGLYGLEIILKVIICKRLDEPRLPRPFAVHDLDELILVSGLRRKLQRTRRPRDVPKNWEDLSRLSKNIDRFRYTVDPNWDEPLATKTLRQLRDSPGGVLPWLLKQA